MITPAISPATLLITRSSDAAPILGLSETFTNCVRLLSEIVSLSISSSAPFFLCLLLLDQAAEHSVPAVHHIMSCLSDVPLGFFFFLNMCDHIYKCINLPM